MPEPRLGRFNTLQAIAYHDSGMTLDGGELGEILLPHRYVPEDFEPGEEIEVFLSNDSEDRIVATTERPLVIAGEVAVLEVAGTSRIGAFLDWGMPKDLLLPFAEQVRDLRTGDRELVHVHVDERSHRLVASAKLNKFVAATAPESLKVGTPVSLLVAERTEIGFKAIVDGRFWGMIHATGGALKLSRGEKRNGYVARIREDGLVDVTLERPGYQKVTDAAGKLAELLAEAEDGFLPVHDKSSPERILEVTGMSKKLFKQAVGALYREGKVRLADDGIHRKG